jgi:hypothetical protein
MILIRYLLIGLIVYLLVRSFVRFGDGTGRMQDGIKNKDKQAGKKVSKEIGEYVDYEEVKK